MDIPKDMIIGFIRGRLGDDTASEADARLPDRVDPDEHAALLAGLGVDPRELAGRFGGGDADGAAGGLRDAFGG